MVDKNQYALALLKAMNPSFVFESPKMPVGGDENMQAVAQYLNSRSYRRDMNNAKEGQEQAYNNHTSPYNNGGSITYDNSNGDFTGVNVPTYTDYPTSPSVTVNGQAISNTNNGLTNDGNSIVSPNGALTVGSTGTQWDTAVNGNVVNNANTIATPKITGFSNSSGDGLVDAQNRLLNKYTKIGDTSDGTSLGHMFNKSNLTFNEPATVKDVLSTDGGSVADRRYRDIVDNPITDTEVEQNQPMRALVEDYFAKRNANSLKDYPDMTFNDNGIEMNKNLPFKQRVEDYIAQRKAQEGTNYPNIRYDYFFDPITDTEVERNEYYDNNPPARGNTNWGKALNPEGYTGNIDLSNRPQVTNPDGSISTVRSKSFNIDGKEVLLPTISPDGKNLTNQEAIDLYKSTGQNLGVFNTIEEANKAAQDIHNQQARQIAQPQVQTPAQQTLQVQQRTKPENQIAKSIALNSNGTITNPAQQTMSNLKDGTVNNDKGTLRTREEYYNALEQDGVTNPFIKQMLYNQNVAPLEEETKRVQLENAFKTYINPNATPEDKSKAKIDIAIAMGKPTFWEDRDWTKKQYEDKMKMEQDRLDWSKQKYEDELAYKQQKYKDSQGRYVGENLEGQTWSRASNGVNLEDVQPETLAGVNAISKIYKQIFGQNMLITSGNDSTHEGGTYSHANGWKVDLSGNGLEDSEKRERFKAECQKLGIVPYDEYLEENKTGNTTGDNLDLSFQGYNGKVPTNKNQGRTSGGSSGSNGKNQKGAFNLDKYGTSAMDYGTKLKTYQDLMKAKNTAESNGEQIPKEQQTEINNALKDLDGSEKGYVGEVRKLFAQEWSKTWGNKPEGIISAATDTYYLINDDTQNGLDPVELSYIVAKAAAYECHKSPDDIQNEILSNINGRDKGVKSNNPKEQTTRNPIVFNDEGSPQMGDMDDFAQAVAWANAAATYLGATTTKPNGEKFNVPTNTSRDNVYKLLQKYYGDKPEDQDWIDNVASQAGLFERESDAFKDVQAQLPPDVVRGNSAGLNY